MGKVSNWCNKRELIHILSGFLGFESSLAYFTVL